MRSVTRRQFAFDLAIAAGGLCLAANSQGMLAWAEDLPKGFRPNAFVMVTADDRVVVWVTRSEMGQGVRTVLPLFIAEELEVAPEKIELKQASTTPEFKGIRLRTSGSGSALGTARTLREAGATARVMLIAAAAKEWNVAPESCRAENGAVVHTPSERRLRYGQLVAVAGKLPVPKPVPLKDPAQFRLIGKSQKRRDGPAIVTGRAVYGLDVRRDGMKYAVIARSLVLKGKVAKFDATKAKQVPGVLAVVPVSAGLSSGVAVVADSTWTAIKARDLLQIEWAPGEYANFSSDDLYAQFRESLDKEGLLVRNEGEMVTNTLRTFQADYEWPYQVHAPIEPMNCTVHVQDGSCEIWVPTQAPEEAQRLAAELLKIPREAVTIHVTMLGGGFGRRLFVDYVQEAVEIGQAVKVPVQLVWTREDDMRFGFLNPPSFNRFVATFGEQGISLLHRSVSSDMSMLDPHEHTGKAYADDGWPWGAWDNPYNFHSLRFEYTPIDSPVPTGPWRAVMYPGTVFARECFLDELAHELKMDPIDLRIAKLKPGDQFKLGGQVIDRGRLMNVLELARRQSNWSQPLSTSDGRSRGRGVACNVYDGESYIAHVAEVSVGKSGDVRVERLVVVVDLGMAINPLGIEGQAESAAVWALTSTLKSAMQFSDGKAVASNFSDYPLLTLPEMPKIETHIVPSNLRPGGFGEHGVPSVAPAVTNAVFAATGQRLRQLPIPARLPI